MLFGEVFLLFPKVFLLFGKLFSAAAQGKCYVLIIWESVLATSKGILAISESILALRNNIARTLSPPSLNEADPLKDFAGDMLIFAKNGPRLRRISLCVSLREILKLQNPPPPVHFPLCFLKGNV